jgi:predicted Na+-dependent transporter
VSLASTLLAVGTLPLLTFVWIDKAGGYADDVEMDYASLGTSLLLVTLPVAGGMLLRSKNNVRKVTLPAVCGATDDGKGKQLFYHEIAEKSSSALGGVFLLAAVIYGLASRSDALPTTVQPWIAAILMEPIGCLMGLLFSKLLHLKAPERKAVALETVGSANALVSL